MASTATISSTTSKTKRSPITPSTITPPSVDRHHSYTAKPSPSLSVSSVSPSTRLTPLSTSSSTKAKTILAKVASRPSSPGRTCPTASMHSPPEARRDWEREGESERPQCGERRRSWEDCKRQADGRYVSFPDFGTEQALRQKVS
ncbi:hypothetical protein K431DRAFT_295257 [Polychaeton citri CBS 116435]|uniref:Uncharacterized protein n=1 Tax=Polychaeton citri CBS 116435 TaxID=1314669 RepID=A0A9P4Q8K2_9PEZI|nr:hypothetical protein K431DRAFT_295257 [Polychaeton citri CBS 116435]